MAEIRVTAKGFDKLDSLVMRIHAVKDFNKVIRPLIQEWQDTSLAVAQKYPPPPPASKYVRTFKLMRSWRRSTIVTNASQVRASVYSDGSADAGYGDYAPYVMGENRQASVHRGRWKTDADIAKETTIDVSRKIRAAAVRVVKGIV